MCCYCEKINKLKKEIYINTFGMEDYILPMEVNIPIICCPVCGTRLEIYKEGDFKCQTK